MVAVRSLGGCTCTPIRTTSSCPGRLRTQSVAKGGGGDTITAVALPREEFSPAVRSRCVDADGCLVAASPVEGKPFQPGGRQGGPGLPAGMHRPHLPSPLGQDLRPPGSAVGGG